jgi:lipopolysaccharide heptosyltransferase II
MTTTKPPQRILVTRMKFIGDVVLTTPAIRSLRNAYPAAFIAYMGERQAVSLLEGNPCLDEILPYDFSRPALLEQSRMALLLRQRRFDLVIDLFGNPRSAMLARLSGAPVRVGPDRKGRGRLYTLRVKDDGKPKSAIAFHNQSLQALGIPITSLKTELFPSSAERDRARLLLLEGDPGIDPSKPLVGIHPGATWPAKHWPAERFGHLAERLSRAGIQVVVFGGPRDGDTLAAVRRSAGVPLRVVEQPSLRELAAVISWCSAFVGNDAGPIHIAVAAGTPTIGLFGPGEENIWFPYDPALGHLALRKHVPCHPCHLDLCSRSGPGYMECMALLQVEEVEEAVQQAFRVRPRP